MRVQCGGRTRVCKGARPMIRDLCLFALAALAEIGGCFGFWRWLRNGASPWLAGGGLVLLAVFAVLLTRTHASAAGRSFAAYGGIYILFSVLWLRVAEGERPSVTDIAGAVLSLVGAGVIMAGGRGQ